MLFDILDNIKQFVLEYDAKRLASDLSPNGYGDINMWGYENPNKTWNSGRNWINREDNHIVK